MTCELHDSYLRLMKIKHAISKIKWAIVWALNYYIAQSRQKSRQLSSTGSCSRVGDEMWQGKPHQAEGAIWALMSWGPEKMLIRCNKESHQPAEWALGLRLSRPGEQERHNADDHNSGVKILQFMFGLRSLSHANLE